MGILEILCFVGIITTILSVIGVKFWIRFGDKYKNKAELMGGIILILLGIKILLEHLNIIAFWLIMVYYLENINSTKEVIWNCPILQKEQWHNH